MFVVGDMGKGGEKEGGMVLIGAVIVIPFVLLVAIVVFDLARMFVSVIYAQELALLVAKIGASQSPRGYAFPDGDLEQLIKAAPGEEEAVTEKRRAFWTSQLDSSSENYYGLSYYTEKDKKVLNLAHGFASALSPRVRFPIPYPLNESNPEEDIGFQVNCSIFIRFAPGQEPPSSLPSVGALNYETVMFAKRDRIYHVECAVPFLSLRLGSFGRLPEYLRISRSAYAYESGTIVPG